MTATAPSGSGGHSDTPHDDDIGKVMTGFDSSVVRSWLALVHGGSPGLVGVSHQDAAGTFHGGQVYANLDAAAAAVGRLDGAGARGIYLRSTTLRERPGNGGRGGAHLSLAMPMFWSDIDFGVVGHAAPRRGQLPLPPDEDAARLIVTTSGLPEPSAWVHSGGGLYALWLLDRPHLITDDLAEVEELSARVQAILAQAAARLGYTYGTGVGDLARVLRIPGSVNRKAAHARPCRPLTTDGLRYTYADIAGAIRQVAIGNSPGGGGRPAEAASRPAAARVPSFHAEGPFDVLADTATWADLLAPAGWTFVGHEHDGAELWRRPHDADDPPSSPH